MMHHPNDHERGTVLVWFAMMVFVLFAFAALNIDMGFARLTQRQMQDAVDASALEGLRLRDDTFPGDQLRRAWVTQFTELATDDDYDLASGTPPWLGMGPEIHTSGGVGESAALAMIDGVGAFQTDMQRNRENFVYGDQVAGVFLPGQPAHEATDYNRTDFVHSATTEEQIVAPAYLVRMRRTNNPSGLDDVAAFGGTSSFGPTLPFMFGRGTVMAKDPSTSYSPRHDGVTIRATAIADSADYGDARTRVKRVGRAYPSLGLVGRTDLALQRVFWESLPIDVVVTVQIMPHGQVQDAAGAIVGRFDSLLGSIGLEVGNELPTSSSTAVDGYVPVYESVFGRELVVGYVHARVGSWNTLPASVAIRRLQMNFASRNVSVLAPEGLRLLDDAEVSAVLDAHRALTGSLVTAVLVR